MVPKTRPHALPWFSGSIRHGVWMGSVGLEGDVCETGSNRAKQMVSLSHPSTYPWSSLHPDWSVKYGPPRMNFSAANMVFELPSVIISNVTLLPLPLTDGVPVAGTMGP